MLKENEAILIRKYTVMPLKEVIEKSRELRQDNKTLKLLELIWQNPGIARRDIGTLAKLSRGTVTTNIAQLLDEGYVTEGEALPENETRPGRSTTGLYLVPDFFYVIGVSFSLEQPKASLFDAAGHAVREIPLPIIKTIENNFSTNLTILEHAVQELMSLVPHSRILIIGLSVAGIIDFDKGDVFYSAILDGCGSFNLKNYIRERFGIPCFLINVAHLFPVMEKRWGAAKEMDNFITLTDSCAAGFFLNGKLYRGWQKHAGELTYMKVTEDQETSADGRNGLLTFHIPFFLLEHRLAKMIENGGHPKILQQMKTPHDPITLEMVIRSIEQGDKFLEQLMAERYEWHAEALLNTAYMLNPEAVLLEEWTARCPQCTVDVVERKMSSYGMSNWHLKTRVLSGKCSREMISRAVAYLVTETVFEEAENGDSENHDPS